MTDESGGINQRGDRPLYLKPFVRDLDVSTTEGKTHFYDEISGGGFTHAGPS